MKGPIFCSSFLLDFIILLLVKILMNAGIFLRYLLVNLYVVIIKFHNCLYWLIYRLYLASGNLEFQLADRF